MSLIVFEDVSKRYGDRVLFAGVSFRLGRGERIGLIGDNGTGKSTLLRLIAGLEEPTTGRIQRARGLRIGYLPQEPSLDASEETLFAEVLTVFAELQQQEAELRRLEAEIAGAEGERQQELLLHYDELRERFEASGGYHYEAEARRVLAGLGFRPEQWEQPLKELSGGERARVELAKLILMQPEVLLLDEPTNHLDLEAVEWLEEYLQNWLGTFIIVSHDRRFLDRLAERTWEIAAGKLYRYSGNYTAYLEWRRAWEERQWKLYERQQEEIARLEEFIRRTRAGQKHGQAKDREKKLERLLREGVEPPPPRERIRFRFEPERPSGVEVLKLHGLVVGYPGKELFRCPDLMLRRGERVALIGPNGSGKTTFLRTILGELPPLAGEVELGRHVIPSYFAQVQRFDPDKTVLDLLLRRDWTVSAARELAARFLFRGEDAYKKVGELSGGELSRLALARLAQLNGNLLLLDEPTNHLDLSAQEALQEALESYEGTVLMVSHDRYLVDRIATQVWEIRDGGLRVYKGNYSYYRRKRLEEVEAQAQDQARTASERRRPAKRQPARKVASKQQEQELEALEALLEKATALEEELKAVEEELVEASYAGDPTRIAELSARHKELQRQLEETLALLEREEASKARAENGDQS